MSWLFTILFAGLVYTSQGTAVTTPESRSETPPAAVSPAVDETEKFERSYPLNANGRVNISNVNGSITVEAWDRSEVKLEYTKVADSKERLADVEVRIESRQDYFNVETDYSYSKNKNMGDRDYWKNGGKLNVEFRLMVPRGAVLNEVETVNGSVTVSDFVNLTVVSAVNGSVNAANLRGTAKLSTVNGEVKADFDRLESGSKISLETVNGRVNLMIPSDASATVKEESLNGSISNDFGLPVRKGKYVGRDLYGKLGSGEVQIRLESVNGALSVGRRNDGKSLSPATNLLQQKDKDEDDWMGSSAALSQLDTAKMNQQIAKAAKESAKVTAAISANVAEKAIADAQKELKNIQPTLDKINTEAMAATADALSKTADLMRSDEMRERMRDAQNAQRDAMARMAEASFFPTLPRVEKKSNSYPVKGVPKVTVQGKGCSVTVRGWDKQEVQYNVTQFTDARNRQPITLKDDHSESAVNITVINPSDEARDGYFDESRPVRIEIFVPRKTNLKIDANGTIRLDGVSGELQVTGGDQSIDIRDSDGKLNVSNADGNVRIIGFRGELVAKTVDGNIRMDGDFTSIAGQTNDGTFLLTVPGDLDADIAGSGKDGFSFRVDDLGNGKQISERNWKFGSGSRKYRFISNDGSLIVQNRDLLAAENQ